MKFKKIVAVFIVLIIAISVVGCGEARTSVEVANNLDKSATRLSTILDKLEEINYNDIVISEISPLSDSTFNTVSNANLQKTKMYVVGGSATQVKPCQFVKIGQIGLDEYHDSSFINETKNNPASNGDDFSNSKNIECKNGNCNSKKTSNLYCENGECNEYNCINGQCYNLTRANESKNGVSYNYNSYQINGNTGYNLRKRSDSKSSYQPKYVNNVSKNFNRKNIENYYNNIEILYEKCSDCVGCNAECKSAKDSLKQIILECKMLCEKLRDGTINLSDNEITTCNSYINNLNL
ncbi:MAG: hypothetical protein IJX26_01245, partial [Clostridia bacterium]|nr:hypothetical protein [Clostridia bacterium]